MRDNYETLLDGEFMLNEFVDRFGPRLAHLNGLLQVLSQLMRHSRPGQHAQFAVKVEEMVGWVRRCEPHQPRSGNSLPGLVHQRFASVLLDPPYALWAMLSAALLLSSFHRLPTGRRAYRPAGGSRQE